jgi:hypothetical protein
MAHCGKESTTVHEVSTTQRKSAKTRDLLTPGGQVFTGNPAGSRYH